MGWNLYNVFVADKKGETSKEAGTSMNYEVLGSSLEPFPEQVSENAE